MGHVQDRWYRPKRDPDTGDTVLNAKGKPVLEKTELYGRGLRYKVRYVDPDGQERSRSFPDRKKKQAEDFLIEVESDKREGKYVDPAKGKIKLREFAMSWLKGQASDGSSRQTLESRLRSQILPFFGERPIAKINTAAVRDWLDWLANRDLDTAYQALLFDNLSSILSAAVEDRRIAFNPCKARSIKKPRAVRPKVIPWTEARVHAIQLAMPVRYRIALHLGAGCGMRQGEILALSPEDVDRSQMLLNVQRQIRVVDRTLVFAPPKGGKTRVVPLPDGVLQELDRYQEQYPPATVTLPWREPGGRRVGARLYVVRDDGLPWYGDLFNKVVWQAAFVRADLTYRQRVDGMHALRHFYASVLLARGVSIKEVAEYLGHSDASITLETYIHLMPSSHQRARDAVNTIFAPRPRSGDGSDGLRTA